MSENKSKSRDLLVDDLFKATQACEHCIDNCCIPNGMDECLRNCRDVTDLATITARLIERDSDYVEGVAASTVDALENCAECCDECGCGLDCCDHCAELLPRVAEDLASYTA